MIPPRKQFTDIKAHFSCIYSRNKRLIHEYFSNELSFAIKTSCIVAFPTHEFWNFKLIDPYNVPF